MSEQERKLREVEERDVAASQPHLRAPCCGAWVAAIWWGDQMRSGFKLANGSADEPGTIAAIEQENPVAGHLMEAARGVAATSQTPERIQEFERCCALLLHKELDVLFDMGIHMLNVGVDYEPSPVLAQALNQAGITAMIGSLPLKTHMHVRRESVAVKNGYGAQWEQLPMGFEA